MFKKLVPVIALALIAGTGICRGRTTPTSGPQTRRPARGQAAPQEAPQEGKTPKSDRSRRYVDTLPRSNSHLS